MNLTSKIYIVDHCGMVESAISRKLSKKGFGNLVSKSSYEYISMMIQIFVIHSRTNLRSLLKEI